MMRRAFWRIAHLLPWRFVRHICDLCDEFPTDPKSLADALGESVGVTGPPPDRAVGWSCPHMSITSLPWPGSKPTVGCGCNMQPILATTRTTTGTPC